MQMVWSAVLSTRAASRDAHLWSRDTDVMGWCESIPDVSSPRLNVSVFPSGVVQSVYIPWAERPPRFHEFLQKCSMVARIAVQIQEDTITEYSLWIHEEQFKKDILQDGMVKGEMLLLEVLRFFSESGQLSRQVEAFSLPSCMQSDEEENSLQSRLEDKGWPNSLPPYSGQLRSISWLRRAEEASRGLKTITFKAALPLGDTGWTYSIGRHQLHRCERDNETHVRIRGAICCDAVGTGKTAVALGLIMLQPRGMVQCEPRTRIVAVGTLVIVPTNLPQQWQDEAARFAPRLRVLSILGVRDLKHFSMEDMMKADVVLITINTLRNKPYLDLLEDVTRTLTNRDNPGGGRARDRSTLNVAARVLATKTSVENYPPLIELVRWRRVVCDEVHEIVQCSRAQRIVAQLSTDSLIGLTGTPDTSSSEAVQSFYPLIVRPCRADDEIQHHVCLQAAIQFGLLRRTMKCCSTPKHVLHNAPLSPAETFLLSATLNKGFNSHDAVVLCCGLWPGETMELLSFDQMHDAIEQWFSHRLSGIDLEDMRRSLEQQQEYVLTTHARLRDAADCSVCMQSPTDTLFLPCGHQMCASCSGVVTECPFCRRPFEKKYKVTGAHGSRVAAAVTLVDDLCAKGERVIVYSQWRGILSGVREKLKSRNCILEGNNTRRVASVRKLNEHEIDALLVCAERSAAGLHLACARHVVILHPFVGPIHEAASLEEQAIGRCLRQGQRSEVVVHHMVCLGSEEENVWRSTHRNIKVEISC